MKAVSILALLLALALLILTACSDNTMVSNSEPPDAAQDATEAATSSPTKNESLSYEIGAVKVISNKTEYEPYVHFASAGVISDGQMTDGVGMYLSFEDISKTLPEVQYDDSFQVLVDGTDAEAPTYSLYNDTFENLYDNQDDFTIPSEAGVYLFCVNVTWSNGATDPSRKEYTLNQYIFKLNISASTLDDNDNKEKNDMASGENNQNIPTTFGMNDSTLKDQEQIFSFSDKLSYADVIYQSNGGFTLNEGIDITISTKLSTEQGELLFFIQKQSESNHLVNGYIVDENNSPKEVVYEVKSSKTNSTDSIFLEAGAYYTSLQVTGPVRNASWSITGTRMGRDNAQSDREEGADTLSDIEAQAEIIVVGKIIDNGTEKVSEPGESPHYGFTVYKLQVTGVYSGEVTSGDTINMIENHLSGGETFIAESNYLPSVKDKEYLFFLYQTKTDSPGAGAWFPVSAEYGRYPVIQSGEIKSAQEYSIEELGLAKEDVAYRAIWEAVIEKYMK